MSRKKVKKENTEPEIIKGKHLTVTKYPNGKTTLKWDDEALLKDVREALTAYENSVKVKLLKTKSSKR